LFSCLLACEACDVADSGSVDTETADTTLPDGAADTAVDSLPGDAPVDTSPSDAPVDTGPGDAPVDTSPSDAPVDTGPGDAPVDSEPDGPAVDPDCGTSRGNTSRAEFIPQTPENVLGDSPEPRYVHLSWLSDPTHSMAFTWSTRDSGEGSMTRSTVVIVCEDEAMTTGCVRVDRDNNGPGVGSAWHLPYSGSWKTIHKAEVCGLSPATTYYYQVGGTDGSTDVFSDPAPFTTAPPPGSEARFTFVAMGDSRGAPDKVARTFAAAVSNEDPAFIVFGGDFVDDGTKQSEWDALFEQSEEHMRSTPIMPVHGNHEKSALGFYTQFSTPNNQNWFSWSYVNAVFVGLNDCWQGAGFMGTYGIGCTGAMVQPGSAESDQAAFMNAVFGAAPDKPFRFVTHHRPIYSETSDITHGGFFNSDLKSSWAPVFDDNDVTMVFNGHDHFYQRSVPIRGDSAMPTPADGVNYIVTAGAGATLYDVKTTDMVVATKSAIHYVAVTIEDNELSFEAVELNPDTGAVIGTIDSFEMTL
jgi:hypothetical protein